MMSKNSLSNQVARTRPVSFNIKEKIKSHNVLTEKQERSDRYLFEQDDQTDIGAPDLTDVHIEKSKHQG